MTGQVSPEIDYYIFHDRLKTAEIPELVLRLSFITIHTHLEIYDYFQNHKWTKGKIPTHSSMMERVGTYNHQ